MTKKWNVIVYLLCLVFFNSIFGQTLQFENRIVERIDVVVYNRSGAPSDQAAVLARLKTKQGGLFSQIEFDEDLKTLAQDFDRIEPVIETRDDRVYIKLELWPKPYIRSIKWHGNREISRSALYSELGISKGSVYERQPFNQAFHKLKAYYVQQGFFEAQLDYHILPVPDANEVDIIIDIDEGRSGKIQQIIFENFTDDERYAVLKLMMTKEYNLFLSWYTQEGIYNEEAIQQDKLVIINYLQNQGYADADVQILVAESCKTNRIVVTIIADKGERYYFGRLSFEGNEVICSEEIDELFTLREGDAFSLEDIRETIEAITDAYGRLGYIDAVVDFEPQLVDCDYRYNVHFKIEEGEQFRVGMIRVFGNTCTQTPVILHEVLLTPGEIFNNIKLKITEEKLRNIGYFSNVNVYAVKSGNSCSLPGNYRDVYIEVEETDTGQFSAFLGYSSVEEIFGGVTITERNFNYKGLTRIFRDGLGALRGGGEYVNFTTQLGQKSSNYTLSWTKPFFMDTQWTVGFDLSSNNTRYISNDYDLDTLSLNLRANYNINQFLRAGFHYRLTNGIVKLHHFESEQFYLPPDATPEQIADYEEWKKHVKEMEEAYKDLRREARIHGLISAVGTSLSYNSTNHPVRPTQGFVSKLYLEFAGVGGDHTFFNIGYLNSYYLSIGSRNYIRYRADFRFLQPLGNTHYETVPLDERIFLGGDFTVRGYRPYRLGPQYEGTHIPRGGVSMQLYSIEFNRRIMKNCEAFLFFDAGQLSKHVWAFSRLSASLGYGVRFKILESVPQITLGMGYPINPRNRSEVKKFFFSLGGAF